MTRVQYSVKPLSKLETITSQMAAAWFKTCPSVTVAGFHGNDGMYVVVDEKECKTLCNIFDEQRLTYKVV